MPQRSYRVLVGWLGHAYMQPSASRSTIRRGDQKARGWQLPTTSRTPEITVQVAPNFVASMSAFQYGFGERSDDKQPTPQIHSMLTLDTSTSKIQKRTSAMRWSFFAWQGLLASNVNSINRPPKCNFSSS